MNMVITKMKKLVVFLLMVLSLPAYSGDPYWLENRDDSQYEIDVYRSASCGCCKTWIAHLKDIILL